MRDWDAVACVRDRGFVPAIQVLSEWGPVDRTEYYNVLVARTGAPREVLEALQGRVAEEPWISRVLARFVPADHAFEFATGEEFREGAAAWGLATVAELEGRSFHVRMRRRGFRRHLSSQEEEQRLDAALLAASETRGKPGRLSFDRPDRILAIETVGGRAALSVWTREELDRLPLLGLD